MLARIKDKPNATEREWAIRTLGWVLHSRKPLSPELLLAATAVNSRNVTGEFDQRLMASGSDYLLRVCGNFVTLDKRMNVFRFIHYSAQEFLRQKLKPEFDFTECQIADVCFTVLGFKRDQVYQSCIKRLFRYAVKYWGVHSQCWEEINNDRAGLIQRFLLDKERVGVYTAQTREPSSPACLVTRFNLPVILKHLLRTIPAAEDLEKPQRHAAAYGSVEVARSPTDPGVVTNIGGAELGTALIVAARSGLTEIAKLLIDAGANPNFADSKCMTVLIAAAAEGSTEIIKLLIDARADLNFVHPEGATALIIAAAEGSTEIAKLLIDAGANLNIMHPAGRTALIAAAAQGSTEIAKLLINAGANLNIVDAKGRTALISAARGGSTEIAKLLIDAGVDVNVRIDSPAKSHLKTALREATRSKSHEIKILLLAAGAVSDESDGSDAGGSGEPDESDADESDESNADGSGRPDESDESDADKSDGLDGDGSEGSDANEPEESDDDGSDDS